MRKIFVATVLLLSAPFYGQEKATVEQSDVETRGQGKISNHEMLKRLSPDFQDKMKIELSIEQNPKIEKEIETRIAMEYDRYILDIDNLSMTNCEELGQSILVHYSKRLGDVYEFINSFRCAEARISTEYYAFNDKNKAKLGANELYNQWSVAIRENAVNRDIRGHKYGDFWVIPGDEGYVDDNPSVSFIYDRYFIKIWIAGQGPDKLDLLDKYALKALKKIKIGLGEIVAE